MKLCAAVFGVAFAVLASANVARAQADAKMPEPGLVMPMPGSPSVDKALLDSYLRMRMLATPSHDHQATQPPEPQKVGMIYITGNDVTQDRVILRLLNLYPGQTLRYPELELGKAALWRSGLFDMTDEATRPSVEVIRSLDDKSVYQDILVRVKETTTGRMCFKPAINAMGLPVIRFGVEERNFDPFRFPESLADIWDGWAFRGAGQNVRFELIEFGLFHCSLPSLALLEKVGLLAAFSDSFSDLFYGALELELAGPPVRWDELPAPAAEPNRQP